MAVPSGGCTHLYSLLREMSDQVPRQSARHHRGFDLISDALPFGRLWYEGPNAVTNATGYAMHDSRSANAVIRVYDATGNVVETQEHKGDFKDW